MSWRLRLAVTWLMLVLMMASLPTSAQESTPEPAPTQTPVDFVYAWSARLAYPSHIIFEVVVDRPADDVALLLLNLDGDALPFEQISITPEDAFVFSDTFSVFQYVWPIPVEAAPPFLSAITYQWDVLLNSAQTVSVEGTLTYTDPRTTWSLNEDPDDRLNILFPDRLLPPEVEEGTPTPDIPESEQLLPATIRAAVAPTLDLLAANTDFVPEFTIALFVETVLPLNPCADPALVRPIDDRSGEPPPCDTAPLVSAFAEANILRVESTQATITSSAYALVNALVEQTYALLWADVSVPAWFAAGLREFYQPNSKTAFQATLQAASRAGTLLSLNAMRVPPSNPDAVSLWQAQSYGMVLYIADQIGVPELFALARDLDAAPDFETAYANAVGLPLAALLPNLGNWVFTGGADSDFLYIPYLAATPSPTPSITPTPFPPTPTFTPTPTDTLTPTATVTGFLTATPLPSLTPTPSLTAAPPTITPRPPGSLATATPEPGGSPAPTTGDNTLLLAVVGGIFALVAVLSLVWLRLSLRRR